MYNILHGLLQDQFGRTPFSPYDIWHILYLVLLLGAILLVLRFCKSNEARKKITAWTINAAFALYMADFFLMPFSYGYIDIDKLPFHICTLMSIMSFWARHNTVLAKWKAPFALLGLVGSLIYIAYPSGVADGEVSFFSYRILQTLLFHGLMIAYSVFSLVFGEIRLAWRTCYRDAIVIICNIVWAMIGNCLYSGVEDGRTFNWCSVVSDPFGLIPAEIAPFVLPFVVAAILFGLHICVYGICFLAKYQKFTQKF